MSKRTANVVPFRPRPRAVTCRVNSPPANSADPFGDLTAAIILAQHRRGELSPALLEALLVGVGLQVPQ